MWGPAGGGAAALLDAVLSVGEPDATAAARPARELLEIVDVVGLVDAVCESCRQRPARYVETLPGVLLPFLLCAGCLL